MDSTQLERGTLESKDRDELTTIANALGGKPGSRARKAEIVDLILDLTGTESNGSSPDSTGSVEEPPAEWEVTVTAEEATAKKVTDEKSEDVGDDALWVGQGVPTVPAQDPAQVDLMLASTSAATTDARASMRP